MRTALALLLVVAAGSQALAGSSSDPPPRFRGRPLTEVLDELQQRGLRLIFSSAVVSPELVVANEPEGRAPRIILDQILAPLGLHAEDGAQGTILIVPGPPPTPAPRDGPLTSVRLIEDIVVTPAHRRIVSDELGSTRSLDGDALAAAPALASDPSRVVTLLPGIAAADGSAAFNARGAETKAVSVILDGLELYDPYHLSAFQSPFSFVDGRIVDRVDFVDGGFTADRGDRHGGFLEISSAQPAEISSAALSVGTINSSVGYAAPTPAGKLLLSARYWYPQATGNTIPFGADGLTPDLGDIYVKLALPSTPKTAVSGHLLMASDRASLVEKDGNERLTVSNGSGYLWFRILRAWSPSVSTDTIVSCGRIKRAREGIAEPEDVLVAMADERDVDFLGVRNDATWSLGRSGVLRGGLDAQFLSADLAHSFGPPGASSTVAVGPSGASIGAYAAYRTELGGRVVAEAGLRWDRQTYTGDQQWSPRLNLMWAAGKRSELRIGAGRFAQSLRIHELRIEDGETAYGPPEISRQLDVTFLHRFAKPWNFRIDAYRHELGRQQPRYENLFHPVELFPEVEPDRVLVAADSATLQGIEISVRGDSGAPLQWWAGYTLSQATDVVAGAEVLRSWDQTHAGSFLVSYRWRPGWFASTSGIVHTGWPTTPEQGPRNSDRYPTYARLDLKAGRSIATAKGNVRVELSVLNATDRKNACCIDEVVDGHTTYDYWLGTTPSLQVTWAF